MEAKKNQGKDQPMQDMQEHKLSYDDMKKALNELYNDYQKLMREYQGAVRALNNIDSTGFFLQYAFKVMEHVEMYSPEFVESMGKRIELVLTKFSSLMEEEEQPDKEEGSEA